MNSRVTRAAVIVLLIESGSHSCMVTVRLYYFDSITVQLLRLVHCLLAATTCIIAALYKKEHINRCNVNQLEVQ